MEITMEEDENRNRSERRAPSTRRPIAGLIEEFIRPAVLGFAFGSLLFVISEQTALIDHALHWLNLSEMGKYLGPKQLAIAGVLLGIGLNVLDKLFTRTRRAFGELLT